MSMQIIHTLLSTARSKRVLTGILLLIAVILGWIIQLNLSEKSITIQIDNTDIQLITNAETVAEALEEAEVQLEPTDKITPNIESELADNDVIIIDRAEQLVLEIDGVAERIYTHEVNPLAILDEQGIAVGSNDILLINYRRIESSVLGSIQELPRHIEIIRSQDVIITDDNAERSVTTNALTVADALHEQDLQFFLADEISPSIYAPVSDNMSIDIQRSIPITIVLNGNEYQTRAAGTTVGDVLVALDLQLTGSDFSVPSEIASIEPNMEIEIIRVTERIELEQQTIPFETISIVDEDLAPDEARIIQMGVDGMQETRYRIREENGLEVNRFLETSYVVIEPVTEIIAIGATE